MHVRSSATSGRLRNFGDAARVPGGMERARSLGCQPAAGAAPWLLWSCRAANGQFAALLHNPATRVTKVPDPAQLNHACDIKEAPDEPAATCQAIGVGRYRVEWAVTDNQSYPHSVTTDYWENIATGALEPVTVEHDGKTWDDPNASTLKQTVCAPLTVGADSDFDEAEPRPISFYGKFALVPASGSSKTYLEECGSKTKQIASGGESAPVARDRLVAWLDAGLREISYIQLPSRQTGSWTIPAAIAPMRTSYPVVQIQLAGSRIFATTAGNTAGHPSSLYSAVLPAADR